MINYDLNKIKELEGPRGGFGIPITKRKVLSIKNKKEVIAYG